MFRKMYKDSQNKEFQSPCYIIWLLLLFVSSLDKWEWKFSEFILIINLEITSIWSSKKSKTQPLTIALCSISVLINITDTKLWPFFPKEWREEGQKQRRAHDCVFTNLHIVQKVWKNSKDRKVPHNNLYCNVHQTMFSSLADLLPFSSDLYKKLIFTQM